MMGTFGAGVGLPTLRDCFPALARAELEDRTVPIGRFCWHGYRPEWPTYRRPGEPG
jgi:hypothetical protein